MPIAPVPASAAPDTTYTYPSANPDMGKLMARYAIKAQDPAFMPHAARRQEPQERIGASYQVNVVSEAHQAPEAAATLSGGRLFPSAINRSNLEFQAGSTDYN